MPNGHDRTWCRLCAAINGFRVRHGHWPTRVRLYPISLAEIRDDLFTPDDFAKILAKVQLIPDDAPMIAEDDSGNHFNYGEEEFPDERPSPDAAEWLGVLPLPDPLGPDIKAV